MTFWAHSDREGLPPDAPGARWQSLAEHLGNVAALSRSLAKAAAPDWGHFHDLAEWCGLLHDYGKYTDCFQQMILTGKGRCPHAIHGAAMAFGGSAKDPIGLRATHLGFAIAGHHAGMHDRDQLHDRVNSSRNEALSLLERASTDLPRIGALFCTPAPRLEKMAGNFDLFTRMLFSCLVDADRLDTAGRPVIQASLNSGERLEALLGHVGRLAEKARDGPVKIARREVLEDRWWADLGSRVPRGRVD